MNSLDKNSLTALLKQTQDVFQNISRQIHWTAVDAEHLDNLMLSKEFPTDISNRMIQATGSKALTEYVSSFIVYKAWQRTKTVYFFNQEFVSDMSQTDDASIYISLLEHLPFKDILFFFPEDAFPMFIDEEVSGMYVHIESHPENLWINFNSLNRTHQDSSKILPGFAIGFPITNGMKISQIFETPEFKKWVSSYKRRLLYFNQLNEQKIEELILAEQKTLNTAINLLYYLSSKNADIKEIKHYKSHHKTSSNPKKENTPAVNLHEVGSQYAEIVYRRLKSNTLSPEDDEDYNKSDDVDDVNVVIQATNSGKKRRPHARRAHWQHYWTGKGRTTLEVRWISDLFIGANRDDQAVIVYDVVKEPTKGKRNPNTSKKKLDKRSRKK